MLTPSILLLVVGLLGAFDIVYFHWHRCGLGRRAESRTEVWIHVARGLIYAVQLAVVPSVRCTGAWYGPFVAIFVADVGIAMSDVVVEPASRRSQGGLPAGEYLMHMVLAVLAGAYLHAVAVGTSGWAELPTAITWAPAAPGALRAALGVMAACCLAVAAYEALGLRNGATPALRSCRDRIVVPEILPGSPVLPGLGPMGPSRSRPPREALCAGLADSTGIL
jgi:hypothetical protein